MQPQALPHSNVRVEDDSRTPKSISLNGRRCSIEVEKDTQFKAQRSRNW